MDQRNGSLKAPSVNPEIPPLFSSTEFIAKKILPSLEEIIQRPGQYPDLKSAINALNQPFRSIDHFYDTFYHNGILLLARSLEPISRVRQLSLPRLNNHIVYRSDTDGFNFAKCHEDGCLEPGGRHFEHEWLTLPLYSIEIMDVKNGHFVSINDRPVVDLHTQSHIADMNEYAGQLQSYLRLLDRFWIAEPRLLDTANPEYAMTEQDRYKMAEHYLISQKAVRFFRILVENSNDPEGIDESPDIRQIDCVS